MNKTSIEYLQYTWNSLAMLCEPLSIGCTNCWHRPIAKHRLANNPHVSPEARAAYSGKSKPILVESRISKPSKRKTPSLIGVQYMGDLFHPRVLDHQLDRIFCTMFTADHHYFVILTKRPSRMKDYLSSTWPAPLPNVIGMVSVEAPQYTHRIDELMQTPLTLRGVSVGPILGPVDLSLYVHTLDWVIVEDESGHNRRPGNLEWVRSIRDVCTQAGTPFFFKQWHYGSIKQSMPSLDGCQWGQYPLQVYDIVKGKS